jgi:hypothetical protein
MISHEIDSFQMTADDLWLISLASSFAMLGIILVVQFLHYPTFRFIEESVFKEYEKFHAKNIIPIVSFFMLAEVAASIMLTIYDPYNLLVNTINLLSLSLLWLVTLLFSIPCHYRLSKGKDLEAIESLIKTNWLRTILWGFRAIWILWLVLE